MKNKTLKLTGNKIVIPIQQHEPLQLPDVLEQAIDSYYDGHPELRGAIEAAMTQLKSDQTSSQTTDEVLMLTRADVKTVLKAIDSLIDQRGTLEQEEGQHNALIDTARSIMEGKRKESAFPIGVELKEKSGPPGEKPNVQADLNMKAVIAFDINPTEYYDPEHRVGAGMQTFALECVSDMISGGCDFPDENIHIQVKHGISVMEQTL